MISYKYKEEHLNKRELLERFQTRKLTIEDTCMTHKLKAKNKSKANCESDKLPKEKHFEDQSEKARI